MSRARRAERTVAGYRVNVVVADEIARALNFGQLDHTVAVAVAVEELGGRQTERAAALHPRANIAQADVAGQLHAAEVGTEIDPGIGCHGGFTNVGDFASRPRPARQGRAARRNREPGVGRQREGGDRIGLGADCAAQVIGHRIVAAEEEGRAIAKRHRRIAALERIAERIAQLRRVREIADIGPAAAKGLEITAVPVAATPGPGRTQVAPVGEVGAARHAAAIAPPRAEPRLFEEAIVADIVIGIELCGGHLAFVGHLIVDQEPIERARRIVEIAAGRRGSTRLQELHQRGIAAVVDRHIGIGLHRRDEAVLGPVGTDVLHFKIQPQPIGGVQLQLRRVVLGHRFVFALEPQQFSRQTTSAGERLNLSQCAADELVALEHRSGARRDGWEQGVVVDQGQHREFVERSCGLRAEIFKREQRRTIVAFPLADGGPGIAIARQVGGAHARTLGHEHSPGWREVAGGELRIAADPARTDRTDAQAWAVEPGGAVAWIGDLRRVGARHQFGLGIGQLQAKGADAGFKGA